MSLLTERQRKVVLYALHRFISDAHYNANMAAQDREGRTFPPGAAEKFLQDATDAGEAYKILKE